MAKKTKFQSFYTKSDPILNYMVGMLHLSSRQTVLEPCAGDGVFVDKLLDTNNNLTLQLFELNPDAVSILRTKYSKQSNIHITETDTLLNQDVVNKRILFDAIIGNPPYGAKDEPEKKELLKKLYPDLYIKESYTLFLYACINMLNEGGILSFIIPDTFLFLHMHKKIRQFMLSETKITEIKLFPSSFFPGVNFGYSNLCIISLSKCSNKLSCLNNDIQIYNGFNSVEEINIPNAGKTFFINQQKTMDNPDSAFQFCNNERISELINDTNILKIGDIAACVTGFYSGDDKQYLHPDNSSLKNAKKYEIAEYNRRCFRSLTEEEKTNGIKSQDSLVPIVKGGNKKYIKPNDWYMDWSSYALEKYRISKKCRLQNSSYYFREGGIAVPMVRSSQLTASLIEGRLFDQSVVGVFPNDLKYVKYLLGFFNSNTCSKIISTINPSTNNSANYIKKIPFIVPNNDKLLRINHLIDIIIDKLNIGNTNILNEEIEIETTIQSIYL